MPKFIIIIIFSICSSAFGSFSTIDGLDHYGKKLQINSAKNSTSVLIFVSAKCPCSDSHIEEIKRLQNKYQNVKFYGVHSNYTESKTEAIEYFQSKKIDFPIIHDQDSKLAKELGALKTPHAYILNSSGNIIYRGGVTNRSNALKATLFYLDTALADIKENRNPSIPKRKTLGCYISLKD